MTIGEKDHLEAVRNQLQRRADNLRTQAEAYRKRVEQQILRLKAQVQALDEIRNSWDAGEQGEALPLPQAGVPISESIDRFLEETGKTEFAAADVLRYIKDHGHNGKHLYNSVYETLLRRVKSGRLAKEGSRFKVVVKTEATES